MPKLFRTLGPVPVPTQPEDIANKGYVDNISPEVLTYFRLGELETEAAGSPGIYPLIGDFGLSDLITGSTTRYSRAPFPLTIARFGLSYQPFLLASYTSTLTQDYVMRLVRYNPVGSDPPFLTIGTATLPTGERYLDFTPTNPLVIGTGPNDVYQWQFSTSGTSQNVGALNFTTWFEFKPISSNDIKSGAYAIALEEQEQRLQELNQELKKEKWYQRQIKELIKSQSITKDNATK